MIANLKPYPAIKDSGVEWLGYVPEHWEVRRLGQIGRFSKGNGGNKEDGAPAGVPCVRYGDLYTTHTHFILKSRTFVSMAKAKDYTPITFGDVLFAASGETIDEIGKSAVNLMQSEACCGGDVILFRPERQVEARYMGYATDCRPAVAQKATMGRGVTVKHIYGGQLKYLTLALPPLPEQAAIVRYLDHADRRIRRYIRAKQKLITLLEEQKQAIIHQAVTGQVDVRTGQPYPAYKLSGAEWLGKVPEHWGVQRARYIFHEVDRRSLDGSEQRLSMSQQLGLVPSHLVENRTLVSESYAGGKLCRAGDLVLNRLKAHLGVFALAQQSGVISPDYTVLRPNKVTRTEYYEQVLRSPSCRGELRTRAKGIAEGFWRLYTDDFNEIRLPLPPKDEQCLITEWIRSSRSRTDRNVTVAEREISLLREYRTRLIADVVTGKLDVREAAARLPDEVEEPEPLDQADTLIGGEEEPTDDLDTTTGEAAV